MKYNAKIYRYQTKWMRGLIALHESCGLKVNRHTAPRKKRLKKQR